MTGSDTAVLVAAALALVAALVTAAVCAVLARRVRELRRVADQLAAETLPILRHTQVVADQAATELTRVGDVLGSAEAVSATVDSASRLAYRAFSNPVVKVVAYSSGLGGALRRLFGRSRPEGSASPRPAEAAGRGLRR